jgi:hypothetical protein
MSDCDAEKCEKTRKLLEAQPWPKDMIDAFEKIINRTCCDKCAKGKEHE